MTNARLRELIQKSQDKVARAQLVLKAAQVAVRTKTPHYDGNKLLRLLESRRLSDSNHIRIAEELRAAQAALAFEERVLATTQEAAKQRGVLRD